MRFRAWDLFSTPLVVQLVMAPAAAPSAQLRAVRFPRLWWCSSNHPNRTETLALNPRAMRFMAGSDMSPKEPFKRYRCVHRPAAARSRAGHCGCECGWAQAAEPVAHCSSSLEGWFSWARSPVAASAVALPGDPLTAAVEPSGGSRVPGSSPQIAVENSKVATRLAAVTTQRFFTHACGSPEKKLSLVANK